MAASAQGQIFYEHRASEALVAQLIKTYKDVSSRTLGRTILQKLCYFAQASGVPLPYQFEIYHYGPFSQEIFYTMENLLLDGIIEDRASDSGQSNYFPGPALELFIDRFSDTVRQFNTDLRRVATMFSRLDPSQMELISTIHYIHSSRREWCKEVPSKEFVVSSVLQVKGDKFSKGTVEGAYGVLREAKLLS
jgi:uncharacterized protein